VDDAATPDPPEEPSGGASGAWDGGPLGSSGGRPGDVPPGPAHGGADDEADAHAVRHGDQTGGSAEAMAVGVSEGPFDRAAVAIAATRASLRRRGWLVVALVVAMAAVVALAVALGLDERRADDLASSGVRTPGTVTKVDVRYSGGRAHQPYGSLTVGFTAASHRRTGSVVVGTDVTGYHEGDHVTVVYDRDHPDRIQVVGADDPDRNGAWMAPALLGVLLLVLAGMAVARLLRTRRVVRSYAWRPVQARLRVLPSKFGTRGRPRSVLELYGLGPDDPPAVSVDTRGLRPLGAELEPTAWVAGDASGLVVAPPGGRPLHLVRRLRRRPATGEAGAPEPTPVDPRTPPDPAEDDPAPDA
jgi:uncharacterized protein DUF3592